MINILYELHEFEIPTMRKVGGPRPMRSRVNSERFPFLILGRSLFSMSSGTLSEIENQEEEKNPLPLKEEELGR